MDKVERILTASGLSELQEEGRFVPRSAKPSSAGQKPQLLDALIRQDVSAIPQGSIWMRCWCIAGRADDGLSWCAQGIQNTLVRLLPNFNHLSLPDGSSVEGLPAIARIIGDKRFLRLASRHHLTTSFHQSWLKPLILLGTLALAVGAKIAEVNIKANSSFFDTKFIAFAVAFGVIVVINQWLPGFLSSRTKSKSLEKFLENFNEKRAGQQYSDFIEDLASELCGLKFPRTVVIDHFDRLEETTRRVLSRYFEHHCDRAIGSEFWVILESGTQRTFARLASLHPHARGYKATKFATQLPLERAEKEHLAEQWGLPPNMVEFESVKRMFEDSHGMDEQLAGRFRDYRTHHPVDPVRYGALDLAYLLSLTSRPGNVTISDRFLRNNLSVKDSFAADLLRQFLRGSTLTRDEISKSILEVRAQFPSILAFDEAGDPSVRVIPEAADVLQNLADELALPPAGLGHLYWSMFWHSVLLRHPLEALWMQKLAHHVLEADASRAPAGMADRATTQMIQATLFTIRGCLETCVFDRLGSLLPRCALLLASGHESGSAAACGTLREECGEVFALFGSPEVAAVLRELRSVGPQRLKAKRTTLESLVLEAGFFSRDIDQILSDDFDRVHAQHLRLQTTWLALSVRKFLLGARTSLLSGAIADSLVEFGEIRERTHRSAAEASSVPLSTTEVSNLSAALWCGALLTPVVAESSWVGEASVPQMTHVRNLVDFANDALAASTLDGPLQTRSGLLYPALRRELASSAAAAVITALHGCTGSNEVEAIPEVTLSGFSQILKAAAAVFGDDSVPDLALANLKTREWSAKVDEWMHLTTLVWQAYGLDHLRDLALIRRAQFNAHSRHSRSEENHRLLLQPEGAVLERGNFSGLLANCVAADGLIGAGELAVYYLCIAGETVLSGPFGNTLRREFCGMVIEKGHTFNVNLDKFLLPLVDDAGGQSEIYRALETVNPAECSYVAVKFINSAKKSSDQTLRDNVRAIIQSYLANHPDAPDGDNLRGLLDFDRVRADFYAKRAVQVDLEVARWQPRTGSWLYPVLLDVIYVHGGETNQVRLECSRILSRDPANETSNCCFLLSITVGQRSSDPHAADTVAALRHLRYGITRWEDSMDAESNTQVYQTLCRLDPGHRVQYLVPLARWQAIHLDREHLRRYPQLVRQGQYFMLFWSYFDAMEMWGLQTEINPSDLHRRLRLSPHDRPDAVLQWKKHSTPPIALKGHGETVVIADFLVIGAYLFEPPLDDNEAFRDDRTRFNDAAHDALPGLLLGIVQLPRVPKTIKALLRSHSERLYQYTLPPDLEEKTRSAAS